MKITTNNQPRPLLYGWQLPESARGEFDYYDNDAFNEASFFYYKGEWYDLGCFTRCSIPRNDEIGPWDGCHAQTMFSWLMVKLVELNDGPGVIVAYCYQ